MWSFLANVQLFFSQSTTSSEIIEIGNSSKPRGRPFKLISYNQRKFECNYCHKRFKSNAHRRIHIRIHTGERKFFHIIDENFKHL